MQEGRKRVYEAGEICRSDAPLHEGDQVGSIQPKSVQQPIPGIPPYAAVLPCNGRCQNGHLEAA